MALLIVGTHTSRAILTIGSFSNVVLLSSPKRKKGKRGGGREYFRVGQAKVICHPIFVFS